MDFLEITGVATSKAYSSNTSPLKKIVQVSLSLWQVGPGCQGSMWRGQQRSSGSPAAIPRRGELDWGRRVEKRDGRPQRTFPYPWHLERWPTGEGRPITVA